MAASIIEFVDVNITVGGVSVEKFSFGTLMGVFTHTITANRQDGPYFSLAEVVAAGFTSVATPAIHAWATAVFSQDDGVDQVLIGRRIPVGGDPAGRAWQVEASPLTFVNETSDFNSTGTADVQLFPATEAIGDFWAVGHNEKFNKVTYNNVGGTAGVGGVVVTEYWNGVALVPVTGLVDGTANFTAGPSNGQIVTFTMPTDWVKETINGVELFYIHSRITTTFTTNPIYDSGTIGGDATWTVSLDAINAANPDAWYITNAESRTNADIPIIAAWHETQTKIYIAQSSSSAILAGTAGNVADVLQTAAYNRSALIYHDTDSEYLDGAWSSSGGGLNLDVPGGVGIWAYRTLDGVPFDDVTATQANNIFAEDANLFGRNLGVSFTSKGTMASGRFIDVQTTVDWLTKRLEEEIIAMFVSAGTKIPYTNAGINIVVAAIQNVLNRGVSFGHLSTDVPAEIDAPDISEVSTQDKIDRKLTVQVDATLAGAIQQVIINFNLAF